MEKSTNITIFDAADLTYGSYGAIDRDRESFAETAINKLKDNEAPGPDAIPSQLLRNGGKETSKKTYDLAQSIWEQEVISKEWKMSITSVVHKKEIYSSVQIVDESVCSAQVMLFSNILFNRLSPLVENTFGDYQNRYRKGRSTTEQIFNIRQVLEKTREFGIDKHHLFIDFKTAHDSINRNALITAMEEFKNPDKLL
ncbi:putative endonuclease-reverse transcriptase [Trichonephila clavipes]|nr:putative endonuclease-reverse transcriptase [Trichonephila clavipes]